MQGGSDAVPHKISDDPVSELTDITIDRIGDIIEMRARPCISDTFKKTLRSEERRVGKECRL